MPIVLILSVGIDSPLLNTRQRLLQSAGYVVVSVQSAKEAVDCFLAGDFDLVLLCHSLSERDRNTVARLIRASGSFTPVLTISEYVGQQDVVASTPVESGPEQLLAGIKDVLRIQNHKTSIHILSSTYHSRS
jgi:CheY-like chemotaxis protein